MKIVENKIIKINEVEYQALNIKWHGGLKCDYTDNIFLVLFESKDINPIVEGEWLEIGWKN